LLSITDSNATFAAELTEVAFKWVWNNNFAEYFMGNYIPPVANSSEIYMSDAGVPISVDLLRARYRGYKKFGVTALPYFSVMEFGGGPPPAYAMTCLPAPDTREDRRALAEHKIPPAPVPPPTPPPPSLPPSGQEWRDPGVYFVNQSLQRANLRSADGQCVYSPGWKGSFVMDPLDPSYLDLLLREAKRHVALLGDDFAGDGASSASG
jgi:hypothetical protein